MLHDRHDAVEITLQAVELPRQPVADTVLLHLQLENVLRPADAVDHLLGLASETIAQIGDHIGDGAYVILRFHAFRLEKFDPRQGRIDRSELRPRDGIRLHVIPHELLHQRELLRREQGRSQVFGFPVQTRHDLAHERRLPGEKQRIGQAAESAVHADAEQPGVDERHVGVGLHDGGNGGPRRLHLPPDRPDPHRNLRRCGRNRIGRAGDLVRQVVIESPGHHPGIGLRSRKRRVARIDRHLEQRTASERQQHGDRRKNFQ